MQRTVCIILYWTRLYTKPVKRSLFGTSWLLLRKNRNKLYGMHAWDRIWWQPKLLDTRLQWHSIRWLLLANCDLQDWIINTFNMQFVCLICWWVIIHHIDRLVPALPFCALVLGYLISFASCLVGSWHLQDWIVDQSPQCKPCMHIAYLSHIHTCLS